MMLEQEGLRGQFQQLLEHEKQALKIYTDLADKTDDPAIREQALQLIRDKERHIRLTERLMEIVE